ncbi:hypothetical protein G7K_4489-t1 [Saitoella complicata NRRL Y-17804]|uniref:Pheromone alpha factor receptor n=2 Tax=Saitoella complicata (strain BCRC 22490 / CBS 7301 / JCM 7358 / NBRC 10748 / NRRL Y-17804) TaxID=698492 RepID=A0A0E9NKH5_SAICN|nr:hypothetical protein G7K_4489-t1 [Saitoella complicata NRRL Y-17804]
MSDSVFEYDASFDYYNQPFNVTAVGYGVITYALSDIDSFEQGRVNNCAIFAAQVGMCGMLALVLMMVTKPEKRRTPLFLVNMASLFVNCLRNILQICYWTGPFLSVPLNFAGDFSHVTKAAYNVSKSAAIVQVFLVAFIQVSLIMQVRVVYSSQKTLNYIMTPVSCVLSATVVVFWASAAAFNVRQIDGNEITDVTWVFRASRILATVSICFFCAIFSSKLFTTIRTRRRLGLKQFGPMQVIFIMGLQTLFIPMILTITDIWVTLSSLATFTTTVVVISLPLSSMWATVEAEKLRPSVMPTSAVGNSKIMFSSNGTQHDRNEFSLYPMDEKRQYSTNVEARESTWGAEGIRVNKTVDVSEERIPLGDDRV